MVIIRLVSGLGNQMFQYALGFHLAKKHKTEMKLDLSFYKHQNLRKFELECFKITAKIANEEELKTMRGFDFKNREFSYFFNRCLLQRNFNREKQFNYDSSIEKIKNNCYLDGYWQSEKYFISEKDELLKEFSFRFDNELVSKYKELISKTINPVSIHIRRTDYVTDSVTKRTHGICSLDYYERSISYIINQIGNTHFFIFSDDPDWVKGNFKISQAFTVVTENVRKPAWCDMQLMSICNHNIIANSSYSWWGAWLNTNPGKIVIAPKKWFNELEKSTSDLIPENWIRL